MSSLGVVTVSLATAVANNGTVAVPYPAGLTQSSLEGTTGGSLVLDNNSRWQQAAVGANTVGFAFGATEVTVTNRTGETWSAKSDIIVSFGRSDREGVYAGGDPGAQIVSAATAGLVFASRVDAQAAVILAPFLRIGVKVGNYIANYVRDASGTALTTADGATWSPDGEVTLEHFGGGTSASSTANRAAMDLAIAVNNVVLLPGFYSFGSARYDITRATPRIVAKVPGSSFLTFTGSTASGLRVAPANTENGSYLSSPRLTGFSIIGPGATHTDGIGLELIMCNGGVFDVTVNGFQRNVRIAGGQLNFASRLTSFGRTGSLVADVTGAYCLSIGPHIQADTTRRPCYSLAFGHIVLSGGTDKNVEDVIKIDGADDVEFSTGYINFGRRSLVAFTPGADDAAGSIIANLSKLYFDGMRLAGDGSGAPHCMYFSDTAFSRATVKHEGFCGNAETSAIYARGDTIRSLQLAGTISTGGELLGDIEMGALGRLIFAGANCSQTLPTGELGGFKITGGRSVAINGSSFVDCGGFGAIELNGTIGTFSQRGNTFAGNAAEVVNNATITTPGDGSSGTSTPTVTFGGNAVGVTYSLQDCSWHVDGKTVSVVGRVTLSAKGSSTGDLRILTNIPIALASVISAAAYIDLTNCVDGSANDAVVARVVASTRSIEVKEMRTSGGSQIGVAWTHADVNATTSIGFSATWRIA